ncbi:hypothetical protein J3R82DRAFT_1228 [Butyriboletus roseoflavus]|nr:hypothetical protein J3R82DRAFT_1228 [Butyriboletus roseoflavus]
MSSIGPQIPEHLLPTVSATTDNDTAESDEDDYTPALPPELAAARRAAGPSLGPTPGPSTRRSPSLPPPPQRVIGLAVPTARVKHNVDFDSDSDSDADVGPQPLPADVTTRREISGVEEFLEREARRRKNVEEAKQPKKLVREEWMLVPPKAGDLLGSLDPTKLKPRQFGRGKAPARDSDGSLWTETPAERQQRIADEVSGRKRRAVNADPVEDEEEVKKRRRKDSEIRKGVDEHTVRCDYQFHFILLVHARPPCEQRKVRGPALVDVHVEREGQKNKDADEPPPAIWEHSRDMSLGGRLMDDRQRQRLLHDAKGLGDRFGSSKSGGFL